MALKSTIHKLELTIADVDRGYYADHALTVARHPSETDERMMVRIAAFALNAHERLSFGRGLSDDDEPALAQTSLTGFIEHWIEVGDLAERRIRKACGAAERVTVYSYGQRASALWWQQTGPALARHRNLTVADLEAGDLPRLAARSMALQAIVDAGVLWLTGDAGTCEVIVKDLQAAS